MTNSLPLLSFVLAAVFVLTSCGDGGGGGGGGGGNPIGQSHTGQYNLGPVDWQESQFHNSCAPYPSSLETLYGQDLAGLELSYNGDGQLCDACVLITTALGKSVLARVVTTGVTGANDIDLSPHAYDALNQGEYPRTMTWQIVSCPDSGNIRYQYQTEANIWWTSLWVRNPRVPLEKVEVKSTSHPTYDALTRGSDGTYTIQPGFGQGSFTLRLTAVDGQVIEETFPSFTGGSLVTSAYQFQ